jgi:ribonuclease HII
MAKSPQIGIERGRIEKELLSQGRILAGVDEVGRGCIAGPVVAACAILNYNRLMELDQAQKDLLRDSKTLSPAQRQHMIPLIRTISFDCPVAFASVAEVETLGIVEATFLAMKRAIDQCKTPFDMLLVDGKQKIRGFHGDQLNVIKGDNLCYAIAAASIVAKEARDQFMAEQANLYPNYGFENHVGYGTRYHISMIEEHGICRLHRKNFEPIRHLYQDMLEKGLSRIP